MRHLTLQKLYTRFVTNGQTAIEDPVLLQRIKALNTLGSFLIIAVTLLGYVTYFFAGNKTFGMMHFISAGIGFLYLIAQRRFPPHLALNGGIAILIGVIFILTYSDGINSSHTFWLYLIPIYSFFMAGVTGGVVWTVVTLFIALIYMLLPNLGIHPNAVTVQFVLDFILSYALVAFFAYWYERSRIRFVSELSAKNEESQRIVYTVSHDLKTPVVSLLGYLEFIKEEIASGDDKQRDEDLNKMEQIIHNMQQMINDLLNLSRVNRAGENTNVSTGDIIVKLFAEVEPQLREKDIVTHMEGRFPTVYAEERKLEEIFRNLLSNAIKYIGNPSQPEITIGVRELKAEYRFFVRDNGIGIDAKERTNIFKPFYSKSNSTVGSGIGLSIVKGFVEDMGGRVWVDSKKNSGSTFWFSLPKNQHPNTHLSA